ncbi:type IIS restriction endonuclease, putative [candidate division TM7 genomosp. GTL1]|nr:type IIS restriction endonuclease, putative [candidate division TM7 genomosp. GTL1]
MSFDLSKAYDRQSFLALAKELLPGVKHDARGISEVSPNFVDIISLGSSSDLDLQIFEVRVSGSLDKRVAIATDAFRLMKLTASYRALVAFYSDTTDQWRLSLMTAEPTIDNGKVKTTLSNPKRYSYLLGPRSKLTTPTKQLISKGQVVDFEDLSKRFAVEVVNNEFYREIAKLYDELVGVGEARGVMRYPTQGEAKHEFAVRLIGRIIFCWFLREKRSDSGTPLIPIEILSRKAANENSYYHSTLTPLFFEVLNKHFKNREDKFQVDYHASIPYLNGGLFSPDVDDHYKFDRALQSSVPGLVDVPDSWLRKLFDLLELYNFTVDENTSYDIDLSIDPEMLGRIFENLLARINPETGETVRNTTGSFYTPREIVEYMVDQSLKEYLTLQTSISEEKLDSLISFDLLDDEEYPLADSEKQRVIDALSNIKILDPACGSGAFPIGVLQKIVFMLQQVDPDSRQWLDKQLSGAGPELRQHLEREFHNKNFDYLRKLGVIRESIYGIDIQPVATEISRLRCFLTLIVDQSVEDDLGNRGIEPLPNLDFKFVTANSLISLGEVDESNEQTGLFEDRSGIDQLKEIRDRYFSSHNSEREALKAQFIQIQNKMLQKMIVNHTHGFAEVTKRLSSWDPFSHEATSWFDREWMFGIGDGFDVVIGNPPYVQLQKNGGKLADMYADEHFETFARTGDIYCLFYERGFQLLKPRGTLSFITSNKWMRSAYGEKLRSYFVNEVNPLWLIDFGGHQVFDSATVDTNILIAERASFQNKVKTCVVSKNFSRNNMSVYFRQHYSVATSLTAKKGWVILNGVEDNIKKKIESAGKPLKEWGVDIYRGILTGYNEAFIIDRSTREKLIAASPKNAEIIRPILRGKDIKRYRIDSPELWLLFIPWHFPLHNRDIVGASKEAEVAFEEQYPAVYEHLLNFKNDLQERNKAETGIRYEWYALQRFGSKYWKEFDLPKVVWGNLALGSQFAFTREPFIINAPSVFFATENLYLLAVLNSRVGQYYIKNLGVARSGGYIEFKPMFVEQMPVPKISENEQEKFIRLASEVTKKQSIKSDTSALEKEIDKMTYKIYGLSQEEIDYLESSELVTSPTSS